MSRRPAVMAWAVVWARVCRRLGIITPRSAVVSMFGWFAGPWGGGRFAQLWEQVSAARVGGVGVAGR